MNCPSGRAILHHLCVAADWCHVRGWRARKVRRVGVGASAWSWGWYEWRVDLRVCSRIELRHVHFWVDLTGRSSEMSSTTTRHDEHLQISSNKMTIWRKACCHILFLSQPFGTVIQLRNCICHFSTGMIFLLYSQNSKQTHDNTQRMAKQRAFVHSAWQKDKPFSFILQLLRLVSIGLTQLFSSLYPSIHMHYVCTKNNKHSLFK